MGRKKKKKVVQIQGRRFRGKKQFITLANAKLAYGSFVYSVLDFPLNEVTNMDNNHGYEPVEEYTPPKKTKKQKRCASKHYAKIPIAFLYSNLSECPNVQDILESKKNPTPESGKEDSGG